jgi:hypothetical protein
MNESGTIRRILRESKVIAVVGLSDKPDRPSYGVAEYLAENGYRIIPVNPNIKEWKGIGAYPDLTSIPLKVDVVDIFRRSEFVPDVVDGAIAIKAKAVWMQLGVLNSEAAEKAEKAGLLVVMDRCMKIEHSRMR